MFSEALLVNKLLLWRHMNTTRWDVINEIWCDASHVKKRRVVCQVWEIFLRYHKYVINSKHILQRNIVEGKKAELWVRSQNIYIFFFKKCCLVLFLRFRTGNKIKVLCKLCKSKIVYHSTISNLRTCMQSVQPKERSRGRSFETASVGILTSGYKTQELLQQCERCKNSRLKHSKYVWDVFSDGFVL